LEHLMQIGVVFPQTEFGGDVGAVRAYAQGVEQLGYAHLLAYDHVVGADPGVHQGWAGFYDVHNTFHEPFVMFGYIAAITELELVTGVIILPQRQTVLVAKQAAEVDLLTNGRFRLGVGLGWNAVEYEALGKDFSNRGTRSEEQVALMRRLWTEQTVSHDGPSERVTGAGLVPPPRPTGVPARRSPR
jgi:probable F420-dependent oxidoreductase